MNWNVTSTGNDFTVMKEDSSIKKGDRFYCTKDVVMECSTNKAYIKGKTYISDFDDCITNENGEKDHYWKYKPELGGIYVDKWWDYFTKTPHPVEKCDCDNCIKAAIRPDKDYFQSMTEEHGKRQFESGAVRDINKNKPFIHCLLGYTRQRFGYHMAKNASKYGENNFLKGIPTEAYLESMDRHLAAYMEGDRTEDHLSAILFGVNGIMLNEKKEEDLPADYYFKN